MLMFHLRASLATMESKAQALSDPVISGQADLQQTW